MTASRLYPMSFKEYQAVVEETAVYPMKNSNLLYPALGLAEEGGEVAGKVKKLWRNRGVTEGKHVLPHEREAILLELGDALWYITALAAEFQVDLEVVAMKNIHKLRDRLERGVIKSEGDNR